MSEFDLKKMGLRFAKAREDKNLSALNVSYTIGRSKNYMYDVENGRSNLGIKDFYEICQVLEIDPREFFE